MQSSYLYSLSKGTGASSQVFGQRVQELAASTCVRNLDWTYRSKVAKYLRGPGYSTEIYKIFLVERNLV